MAKKAKAKKLPAKKTRKAAAKPGKGNPDTKIVKVAFVPGKEPLIPGGIKGKEKHIPLAEIDDPAGISDRMPGPEDANEIAETARSLAEVGQLQSILVEETPKGYVRVFGRRRIAAAKRLGWKTIRAVVCGVLSPAARRAVVLAENIHHKSLTAIEESLSVAELLELRALEAARQLGVRIDTTGGQGTGGSAVHGQVITGDIVARFQGDHKVLKAWAHDVMLDPRVRARACELVAIDVAKDPSWVRDRMYLFRLDEDSRALVREGKLPLMHAREISKVGDATHRRKLAKDYAAGGSDSISDHEPGKFESLRYEVSSTLFRLATAPWRLEVQVAGKRPCEGCPFNSTSQPGLFDGGGVASGEMFGGRGRGRDSKKLTATDEEKGVCTNGACYQVKLRTTKAAASDAAKKVVDAKGEMPAIAKEICKPSLLSEKIADRKALAKSSRTLSKTAVLSAGRKAELKLSDEKREAGYKLAEAQRTRVAKHEPAIAKALNAKPGLWAAYAILRRTKEYEATMHWDDARASKAGRGPALVNAAKLLGGEPIDAILAFEKMCGRNVGIFDKHRDGKSGFLDLIAGVFGIDVGAPPVLEDFMPSARKAKADAEKKAKAEREEREEPAQEEERESESAEPHDDAGEDAGGDE